MVELYDHDEEADTKEVMQAEDDDQSLALRVQSIWRYTRQHRLSMDSERHCSVIKIELRGAVAEVEQEKAELQTLLTASRAQSTKLRQQLKTATELLLPDESEEKPEEPKKAKKEKT